VAVSPYSLALNGQITDLRDRELRRSESLDNSHVLNGDLK